MKWMNTGMLFGAIAVAAANAHAAPSNADFAAQVKAQRKALSGDPKAVEAAKALCENLSPVRAMDEPRCVALQRHIGASSTKSPGGPARF